MTYKIIVFLPLVAALLAGFFGRQLGDRGAQLVTSGAVTLAAILSVIAFIDIAFAQTVVKVTVAEWIVSGDLALNWALQIDTLTVVMLVVVNGISALVHWYSIGYMAHDPAKPRFMAYLSLFTFAMLMLVTADNFVQLFFGWEGVGLASYLLIGFWYQRPAANAAAIKAFVVNRVGDFGFSLGIFAIFLVFGSLDYETVFSAVPAIDGKTFTFLGAEVDIVTTIALLLFVGAMGKSAQLGLHTWLPDAMEGPTPVSALIHAATMVTAGVFMVARCSPIFEYSETALSVVTVVGAATAFFAATIGLVQNDIKRVVAYSTCSQLGYMFFALGVGAYGAGIFHLFTHAFFKALLFLSAGSVIHAMGDEQDMRRMGGLARKIPWTFAVTVVGTLALTGFGIPGVFGFAGFYSKDVIVESAFAATRYGSGLAFLLGTATAFLTGFYAWRVVFMTFLGKSRADPHVLEHAHESPAVMMVPLLILALGATFAGYWGYGYFVGEGYDAFWGEALFLRGANVLEAAHHVPLAVKLLPLLMGLGGLALAAYAYLATQGRWAAGMAQAFSGLYALFLNKWYVDELYNFLFVRPALWLGRVLWKGGDGRVIDGFGPDGVSQAVLVAAGRAQRLQSGYLYHYAFAMLIGVFVAVTAFIILGAGG
ncbi:MAG: NADH-quinone oxidoreductase subunit L [Pseudomonadota bacterium]